MSLIGSYKMRLKRQKLLVRARRKSFGLRSVADRTTLIEDDQVLLFSTMRNELVRLPHFFQYYRDLGIEHFLIVDNDSDDGSREFLQNQPDVSLWSTKESYRSSRFGVDWLNWLLRRYGHGHWTLVVDPDELFVFPFCDTRPIQALTGWLDSSATRSFGAMLLDVYPKGPLDAQPYRSGQNPLEIASWFDSGNYTISRNPDLWNLWIRGGPRARMFFADNLDQAPSLNKVPLVRWDRRYAYVSSTHMLLPRGLNIVYEQSGGEKASGALIHTKLLDTFSVKAKEELTRKQHYAASREYIAYAQQMRKNPDFWCEFSERYNNWRQLEILGLISKGNWA